MKIENNPITNFELLDNIPEGECFKCIDSDEIFMKTNETNKAAEYTDDDEYWELAFYCVNISNGNIRYISHNTQVRSVSGKFVIDSAEIPSTISDQTDKKIGQHWTLNKVTGDITCDNCGCTIFPNDVFNGEPHFCTNCGLEMKG